VSDTWDFPAVARTLARYFARYEEMQGSQWTAGRIAAEAWAAALEDGVQDDRELASLDALIAAGTGDSGTAWTELRLGYRAWRCPPG
jgi:hypothetical protein